MKKCGKCCKLLPYGSGVIGIRRGGGVKGFLPSPGKKSADAHEWNQQNASFRQICRIQLKYAKKWNFSPYNSIFKKASVTILKMAVKTRGKWQKCLKALVQCFSTFKSCKHRSIANSSVTFPVKLFESFSKNTYWLEFITGHNYDSFQFFKLIILDIIRDK